MIFSILFIFSTKASSKVSYIDHAIGQFAGELGLISVGLGKTITPKYALTFIYGYVPPEISKTSTIETLAFKQTYDFYDWNRMRVYTGLNIYHVLGLRYQTSQYGESPKGYYPIGSLRALLYLGASIHVDHKRKISYYFESGINDVWVTNFINNPNDMNVLEHFSMALGVKYLF